MRLQLDRQRVLTVFNVVALMVIFVLGFRDLALPTLARLYYEDEYKELMFQCDNVMREHFIAKSQARVAPSPDTMRTLQASEVGLMTCNDYDTLRKRLLVLGLDENQLAQLGLEAIEEKANDIRIFVETHEIRY